MMGPVDRRREREQAGNVMRADGLAQFIKAKRCRSLRLRPFCPGDFRDVVPLNADLMIHRMPSQDSVSSVVRCRGSCISRRWVGTDQMIDWRKYGIPHKEKPPSFISLSPSSLPPQPRMDQYFNQMEKIVKERKTSSRIRFMLQDVIDLRLVSV